MVQNHREYMKKVQEVKNLFETFNIPVQDETPERFMRWFSEISLPKESLDNIETGLFREDYDGMVIQKDIPIYSLCEHHILPWFGTVSIAYIASNNVVIGLSKFTRIVRYFSSGLTIQERVCKEIADYFMGKISENVIVMIEGIHSCMVSRGVLNPFSRNVTIDARGAFREKDGPRLEFFSSIGMGK